MNRCFIGLLAAVLLLSACEEKETPIVPTFPEVAYHTVAPGDEFAISFTAALSWKLVSDAFWCKVDGQLQSLDTSGDAGEHAVKFVVSDEGHDFEEDKATITLHMGDESKVIAEVTRIARKYDFTISDGVTDYTNGQSVVIGTSGVTSLQIDANFNLDLLEIKYPKWIDVKREANNYSLYVKEDTLKYTINQIADSIVFFKDTTISRSLHIQYLGMDKQEIHISETFRGTIVSRDGTYYHTATEEGKAPVDVQVTVLNDAYRFFMFNEDNGELSEVEEEDGWIVLDDDKRGNISITFSENIGDTRKAYLFVLPEAVSDSIVTVQQSMVSDFFFNIEESVAIKEEAMRYLIGNFSQEGLMTVKFTPDTQWGVRISSDGRTYENSLSSIADTTYKAPIDVAIQVTDNAYELIYVNYDSHSATKYSLMDENTCWIKTNDDKQGNISLSFAENTGNERTAYLFVLAQPKVEEIINEAGNDKNNLIDFLFDDEGVKVDAEQYLIAELTQEGVLSNSMKVILAVDGYEYLEVQPETNSQWLDVAAAYGIADNNVFHIALEFGVPYILNPMLGEEEWNPSTIDGGKLKVYGQSGTEYIHKQDYMGEPTMMEQEGNHYLFQGFQFYIFEPFIVYFVDAEGNYLKALVVEIAEFEE